MTGPTLPAWQVRYVIHDVFAGRITDAEAVQRIWDMVIDALEADAKRASNRPQGGDD